MLICCLDLEGVLVPEIWIHFSKITKIKELELTTRDIPDYNVLMRRRLKILKENGLKIDDIHDVIRRIKPLPGAKTFLKQLRSKTEVIILSDTFYEFAGPLMKQLDYPTLFCNWLTVDKKGNITGYKLRQPNGKEKAVRALKKLNFRIHAAGDSYNDLTMIKTADRGIFFNPPQQIVKENPKIPVTRNYNALLKKLLP